MKTGFTDKAGYCLVASGQQEGMRLIAVTLGDTSVKQRNQDTKSLLSYGFRFFTHMTPPNFDQPLSVRTYGGMHKTTEFNLPKGLSITVPRDQQDQITLHPQIPEELMAPVAANSQIGQVTIKLGDQTLLTTALTNTAGNPLGGIWRRWTDKLAYQLREVSLPFNH